MIWAAPLLTMRHGGWNILTKHTLQHHFRKKVQVQHQFHSQLNVTVRTSKHDATRHLTKLKSKNPIKMRTMNKYGESPSFSAKPDRLQEFRENLVDERFPESHDSQASCLFEPSVEPLRRVVSGQHSIYNGFNLFRAKQKLHRKLRGACKSSWSRLGSQ